MLLAGVCADDTFQGLNAHRTVDCNQQPYCKAGEKANNVNLFGELYCDGCPDGTYQSQPRHRQITCVPQKVITFYLPPLFEQWGKNRLCVLDRYYAGTA